MPHALVQSTLLSAPNEPMRDEIARQLDVVWRERWQRIGLTALAFALSAVFLPWWVPLILAFINLSAEFLTMRLMRGLDPARDRRAYTLVLLCVFVMELVYVTSAGLIWQLQVPHAQALSLGLLLMTLIHLTTVRAIHLPFGLAGIAGVAVAVLVSNTAYWVGGGDWIGLALSTIGAVGGLSYTLTAMISNNRLHRATAEGRTTAQAADAAKSRFLAQMSHELRTPLNGILGMGQVELAHSSTPEARERLSVLVASAKGLGVILDDILDMSAIQEGKLPVRPGPADPRAEIEAALALFRPLAEAAGLRLRAQIAADLPPLASFDAQRLRQCLSNLLSNAIKNTRFGGIILTAGTEPGHRVWIEVLDTGPGIPAGQEHLIFEPFQRGPLASRFAHGGAGAQPGTGLGLSISRVLAQRMGGDLVVKASPSGACFRLTVAMPPLAAPTAPARHSPTPEPALNLHGRRVLVIDDIASNRLVATSFLRLYGATSCEAESGLQAIAIARKGGIDLVLLDMNMPGMDGIATFAGLRRLPGSAGTVPVIAMTADAAEDHRRQYLGEGLDGYIAKPMTPDRIVAEIGRVLGDGVRCH